MESSFSALYKQQSGYIDKTSVSTIYYANQSDAATGAISPTIITNAGQI